MENSVKQSYKFYQNKDCVFFPCHEAEEAPFNCLFCYCPLYFLGEKCKGNFTRIGPMKNIKDCTNCLIPHKPENYEYIVRVLGENIESSLKEI